ESLQQFGSPDDSWMTPHPETGGPNFASVDEALRACVNRGRGYAPFSALPQRRNAAGTTQQPATQPRRCPLPRLLGGGASILNCGRTRMRQFRFGLAVAILTSLPTGLAQQSGPYKVLKSARVGGEGGWDYIYADAAGRRLYIPRRGVPGAAAGA